jgi:hypothetical protein
MYDNVKLAICEKKRANQSKKSRELIELKKNRKPRARDCWKKLKTKFNKGNGNIPANEFKTHFSKFRTTVIDDVKRFNESREFTLNNPTFHDLNVQTSLQEVTKRNKSPCPSDHL